MKILHSLLFFIIVKVMVIKCQYQAEDVSLDIFIKSDMVLILGSRDSELDFKYMIEMQNFLRKERNLTGLVRNKNFERLAMYALEKYSECRFFPNPTVKLSTDKGTNITTAIQRIFKDVRNGKLCPCKFEQIYSLNATQVGCGLRLDSNSIYTMYCIYG